MRASRCATSFHFLRAMAAVLLSIATALAEPMRFEVPAQSAATALVEFARQGRVEVLFGPDELKEVKSNPLSGTYEPYVAIELLLRGTGFDAVAKPGGKFVVVRRGS